VVSENNSVKITVEDNGSGIADDTKSKIFEPKFTTKTSGMGLGLAMVKNIVETFNGSITFTSQLGEGTTFTVTFPKE
jgi:two-component system nitrogen regulation sensor histidine kinase NtrY